MLPSFIYFCNKVVYQLLILAFGQILGKNFIFTKKINSILGAVYYLQKVYFTSQRSK
jgi:hypothetical protein